jgi:hypothetical protein
VLHNVAGVHHYGNVDGELSRRDRGILEFEAKYTRDDGSKEARIRAELGLPKARYYQLLNKIIDSPDALRAEPMLIKRLLNRRDSRTRARANRTLE